MADREVSRRRGGRQEEKTKKGEKEEEGTQPGGVVLGTATSFKSSPSHLQALILGNSLGLVILQNKMVIIIIIATGWL